MFEKIAIIGGGLMGHGIAQVFACAGCKVRITDPIAEVRARILDKVAANLAELDLAADPLAHISIADSLEDCVADADVVIEAAPENLELKQQIFADVEKAAPASALFASNTSVIPISQIMAKVKTKAR